MAFRMGSSPFNTQFATRLKEALIKAGHTSERSTSGINIHVLTDITGYSSQICRKYLQGRAIPEPSKLTEIAMKLNVSPGWLLFGDPHAFKDSEEILSLPKPVLQYLFSKITPFISVQTLNLPELLFEICNNLSQIDTNIEQSKKIIDLGLNPLLSMR